MVWQGLEAWELLKLEGLGFDALGSGGALDVLELFGVEQALVYGLGVCH